LVAPRGAVYNAAVDDSRPSASFGSQSQPAAVRCTHCGKQVEGARVGGLDGLGFTCLTCQLLATPVIPPPPDLNLKRNRWLVIAAFGGIAAICVGVVGFLLHRRTQQILEADYPVVALASQRATLESGARTWAAGRATLLANLAAFHPPDELRGTAACPLSIELPIGGEPPIPESFASLAVESQDPDSHIESMLEVNGELPGRVGSQIEAFLEAAERGRFRTATGRDHLLRAISSPLVVLKLTDDQDPELATEEGLDVFRPGHRAGTAYVFDPQTGALRCAGRFDARSSESVRAKSTMYGFGNQFEALAQDFDEQVTRAIQSSLRAIE
jgi:hypothetical protein